MLMLDFNFKVRQRAHQLLIERSNSVASFVVFVPGFVVVTSGVTECGQDAFQVMCVFKAYVMFDQGYPRGLAISRDG